IQVIAQGLLAVGLSYWITAIWFDSYVPKLIIIIAILVLIAVGTLLKAIFEKVKNDFYIEGEILDLENSPELNSRITDICKQFKIAKPDTVIGGIDDNFFVTEQSVIVNGKTYFGKSLYVSLSLLKVLSKEEADAVIAHEMAHFSGNDTLFSKKISPVMAKYQRYLEVLYEGGITLPVFYYMLFFWSLYTISLSKLSREREFRADALAAEIISPHAIASSLAKISAYAHYRFKIEDDLFNKNDKTENLNISLKVVNGFPSFLENIKLKEEILDSVTPHPFDSHPSFDERLENVGIEASYINKDILLSPVSETWYSHIHEAESLESKMWESYESGFREAHDHLLSYKLQPNEPWEIEIVEKFFPEQVIEGKKSGKLTIDYEKLAFTGWENDVYFKEIENCNFEEHIGAHRLAFKLKRIRKKVYLKTGKFKISENEILEIFNAYYSRYLSYLEYQKES
ncbi:MAG: M48 family metallopeptidase, partial [Lentisphaeraceae bacterium]|nr:M48 family metallopeptidase [Lentisphaeraceae bacterium]